MIIEFKVSNFRSIKEPVTLSTAAASMSSDDSVAVPTEVPEWDLSLLNVLGIFGANASGKTNILRALDSCLLCMGGHKSFRIEGRVPFLIDDKFSESPTCFELKSLLGDNIYVYSIAFDSIRVIEERLVYLPSATKRENLLFDRKYQADKDVYIWKNGDAFSGPHVDLQSQLKQEEPYLGFLAGSLNVEILRPLVTWTSNHFPGVNMFISSTEPTMWHRFLAKVPGMQEKVGRLLSEFDTGIDDLFLTKADGKTEEDEYAVMVRHHGKNSVATWPIAEESIGNQRLFTLAAKLINALERGGVLVIDELGGNLHPNLSTHIIRLFQQPEINRGKGQLIFSSHDNVHMNRKLMRRDQIWFTKRRRDKSTALYPLTDFNVRNDLAVSKAYLEGRFEAVPILGDESDLGFLERKKAKAG